MFLLCGSVTLVSAEADGDIPTRGPIPFSVYDLDGSGMIDEQEFSSVQVDRLHQRAAQAVARRLARDHGDGEIVSHGCVRAPPRPRNRLPIMPPSRVLAPPR